MTWSGTKTESNLFFMCVFEREHTKQIPAASIEVLFISIYNSPLSYPMFSFLRCRWNLSGASIYQVNKYASLQNPSLHILDGCCLWLKREAKGATFKCWSLTRFLHFCRVVMCPDVRSLWPGIFFQQRMQSSWTPPEYQYMLLKWILTS